VYLWVHCFQLNDDIYWSYGARLVGFFVETDHKYSCSLSGKLNLTIKYDAGLRKGYFRQVQSISHQLLRSSLHTK